MDSLHHPSLNATLRGVPSVQTIRIPAVHEKRILQFRGIKFASIPARFSFAELIDDWNGAELDCTAFGPICPQFKDIDISQLVGLPCGDEPKEEQDEFECLRLNVTLPEDAPHNPEKIPVMVWIHGGSFMATIGSGQTKYGDSKPMVAYAKHLGTPVILVSINYRVNIFGFAYFKATNKLPRTICNLGLHDQKLALRWVKRNIAEFGGDPQKITIFGESAGAISVHAHMQCPYSPILGEDEALFWRVIMQSGSLYTSPPAPPAAIQGLTRRVCAEVGIGYDDIDDAVERLRVVPPDQLLEVLLKLSVTVMWVTDDSEVSGGGVLFARGKRDWRDCNYGDWFNGVMLGDVEHEAVLQHISAQQNTHRDIAALLLSSIPDDDTIPRKVMAAYDIPCPPTRDYRCLISEECDVAMEAVLDKHARKGIINFLGDMKISYTTTQLATSFLRASFRRPWNVYQYVLDQPGPFQSGLPAVIEGRAYHTVDLLLLFQGYDLKDGHRNPLEVGLCMQDCWATFAHGQGEPWVGSNEIFAFGPGDDWAGPIEMTRSDGSGEVELGRRRNLVAWKVLNEIGWDALRPVVDAVARRIIIDGLFRVWID